MADQSLPPSLQGQLADMWRRVYQQARTLADQEMAKVLGNVIRGGKILPSALPIATVSSLGAVEPDGSTITITAGGVISAPSGGGGGVLGVAFSQLGADVTMTSANTYYDGPAVGIGVAATNTVYAVWAETTVLGTASAGELTIKIWDGSTNDASAETTCYPSGELSVATFAKISLSGTATIKVSAAGTNAGNVLKAATTRNAAGNTATNILAIRLS